MRSLVLLAVSLVSSSSLAQGRPLYRAPPPRPPPTAGTLERDPASGNYRLTYTDEEGISYTIPVESAGRGVFRLGVKVSVDPTYTSIAYSYRLANAATDGHAASIGSLFLPCDDSGAAATSRQWIGMVSVAKLLSARKCGFIGLKDTVLRAGEVLTDATVTSRWLPGIDKVIVAAGATPPVWPSGEATPKAASRLAHSVNSPFLGGTKVDFVVPLKDPGSFATPDLGIGLVLADLSQACSLGWFKQEQDERGERGPGGKGQRHKTEHDHDDDEICNSLAKKLAQAQSAALNRDFRLAGKRLRAVQKELSKDQQDEDGADPAFTLLDTNVGYVLSRLPVDQRRPQDDD